MNAAPADDRARLEWAVMSRFTGYVRGMNDGRVFLEGGAQEPADGVFAFPLVKTVVVDADNTDYVFGGTVRFAGHGGMLNLPLGGIEIRVTAGGPSQVTIADPDEPDVRLLFATATAEHAPGSIRLTPALAEDGAELYFYRYPTGFALEPADIFPAPPSDPEGSDAYDERPAYELG